jgi:hydrogenase maturation protein HypF
LAVGGEQKNTICVSKNGYAYLSQYLGNLEEFNFYENFKYVLKHFTNLFDINIELIVHDMHPAYLSAKYAKAQKIRTMEVQHHHAHMVSCMAEHFIYDIVIGVIFDGTGFGLDGAVWGGEFFIGNRHSFKRAGQLEYVNIQGGEQAIKEPWRCAASYVQALGYNPLQIIQGVEREKIEVVTQALNAGMNCFLSSSIGRLFDAVSALIGIRNNITYDGQAAIELENAIEEEMDDSYSYTISEIDGVFYIQYKDIIEGILKDIERKELISKISAKFHNSLAEAACALVVKLREKEAINKVALSGGVFENQYLLKRIYKSLVKRGFQVFYNEQIPINDGGLSFGQLHAASEIMEKEG